MKTILCFGDSLTWCFNPTNWQRYNYEDRWTTVLEKTLGAGYRVIPDGLNGRTSCWNHPFLPNRNGMEQFPNSLEVNAPLDLVVIMLGTNDMIKYLNVCAEDSANALMAYLRSINESTAVNSGAVPKMLVIAPLHLGNINSFMNMWYHGNVDESKRLASCIKIFCDEFKIPFLDSNKFIQTSDPDGVHISIESNKVLGEKVAGKVLEVLG